MLPEFLRLLVNGEREILQACILNRRPVVLYYEFSRVLTNNDIYALILSTNYLPGTPLAQAVTWIFQFVLLLDDPSLIHPYSGPVCSAGILHSSRKCSLDQLAHSATVHSPYLCSMQCGYNVLLGTSWGVGFGTWLWYQIALLLALNHHIAVIRVTLNQPKLTCVVKAS